VIASGVGRAARVLSKTSSVKARQGTAPKTVGEKNHSHLEEQCDADIGAAPYSLASPVSAALIASKAQAL